MFLPTRTLYTVFEVKFRRDCEYVEPENRKNRYIAIFGTFVQVFSKKNTKNTQKNAFFHFFLACACVYAKKAVPLYNFLKVLF